jgi:hypothetical protein
MLDYKGREKEDWACSFVSLRNIRRLSEKGKKNQKDILEHGIPWMDIFDTPDRDISSGQAIAEKIMNVRNKIDYEKRKKLATTAETVNDSLSKRANWENLDTHKAVVQVIPKYICQMFKSSFNPSNAPFNEASIISTIPINQIPELKID